MKSLNVFNFGAGGDPTAAGRREAEARRLEVKDILLNGSGHVYLPTAHVIIDPLHSACVGVCLPVPPSSPSFHSAGRMNEQRDENALEEVGGSEWRGL